MVKVNNYFRRKDPPAQPASFRSLPPLWVATLTAAGIYLAIAYGGRAQTVSPQPAFHGQSWVPHLAQTPLPLPLAQQGNQVVLNGRSLSLAWSQRQQRIGIADVGLMQLVGVELLDSDNAAQQPVQWFSQPTTVPLVLPTWLTAQYRYLDITELTQRAGWQVQPNGAVLQISTPAARITGIRQGRQSWGDRIVVDLEQPAPWQVVEQSEEVIISVDARINPAVAQSFIPTPGNRFTSLKVESNGNQTLIRIGVPAGLRPRTWTLPTPNRLVIDIRPDSLVPRNILWAPGIRWQQQLVNTGSAQFPVVVLAVDPRHTGLTLKPIWTNPTSAIGIDPLITIAQRWQVGAAINGGFFNRNNQLPLGAVRHDNRWISGPILNRGAIAWNQAGEIVVGRLSLQETITTAAGSQFPIIFLNTGYVQAGLARYTPEWGTSYTNIIDNETILIVENNQVTSQRVTATQGQTNVPIPPNGYLLVARSFNSAVNALPVGTTVQFASTTTPDEFSGYPHIMGAGPLLIQNRQIVLNAQVEQFSDAFARQAAVRSAIGKTADGHLLIVAMQNRIGGMGPTLGETADIMQRLGAVDALNLDGGSSTSLYLGGQLLNRSPRTAARVHNGIGIFIQPSF